MHTRHPAARVQHPGCCCFAGMELAGYCMHACIVCRQSVDKLNMEAAVITALAAPLAAPLQVSTPLSYYRLAATHQWAGVLSAYAPLTLYMRSCGDQRCVYLSSAERKSQHRKCWARGLDRLRAADLGATGVAIGYTLHSSSLRLGYGR